jgi:D-alanyl-D-alanine carboxypeptidase
VFSRLVSPMLIGIFVSVTGAATFSQESNEGISSIVAPLCKNMRVHHVLNPSAPVDCSRLKLVSFTYLGFDAQEHRDGQIMVIDAIAKHVLKIFSTLRERKFPLAKTRLMSEYNGDDHASMDDNNTSAFNVRTVFGGKSISLHAFGVAIDVNTIQNPYLERVGRRLSVSPKAGAEYLNRKNIRPGMAETVVDVFADNGLGDWGGYWRNPTDYQHFQVNRKLALQLARQSPADAETLFERYIVEYLACVQKSLNGASSRKSCAANN